MPLRPLLQCADLEATKSHYRDVLGFAAVNSERGTLTVLKDDCSLIFTRQELWQVPMACSGTFYFAIADVDGYYQAVKDKASIAWPLQDMSYGSREFGLRDCNGYYLAFTSSGNG